jgi:GxxExxY protein
MHWDPVYLNHETVLAHELRKVGLEVKTQVPLPLVYEDVKMEVGYRIDILVEDKVIIEVKSVENLAEVHHKQVITYLKLSNKKLGLLVNFNCEEIDKSIFRKGKWLIDQRKSPAPAGKPKTKMS